MLTRRIDAFSTGLLPRMPPKEIQSQARALRNALLELEEGSRADEIIANEKENEKLITERSRHAAEVLARRKGRPKVKRRRPNKGRRITQ